MAKEIKIKLKNADKLEFELLEDANKGDYIDLYSAYDKTSLEPLKEILSNQKEKIIEEWRKEATKEIKDNAINSFKASDEYLRINQENQKYKLENEDLNKKLVEDKKQLKLEAINEYKNSDEYKKIIDEVNKKATEIVRLQEENKNKVSSFKDSQEYKDLLKKSQENKDLINQINDLNKNKKLEIDNEILKSKDEVIKQFKKSEEYLDLIKQIQNKNDDLKKKDKEIAILKTDLKNAVLEYKDSSEFKDLLAHEQKTKELETEIKNINDKQQLIIQNKVLEEKENAIKEFKKSEEYQKLIKDIEQKDKDLEEKKNEIFKLENERNLKSNKLIGEDLENWINNKYQDELQTAWGNECSWEKANEIIDGTKPDFIFKVRSNIDDITNENDPDYYLGRVVIEAKNERLDSKEENKKRSEDYLKKLANDLKKVDGDYAILVSQLSKDGDFSIRTNPLYPKIFIVRPEWFTSLLIILRYIFAKKRDILLYNRNNNLVFKKKEAILKEFDDLKKTILENAFRKINSNLKEIQKQAENIKVAADKILDSQRIIVDTHMNTIKNKIDNFKIENEVKKISKLEIINNNENNDANLIANNLHDEE